MKPSHLPVYVTNMPETSGEGATEATLATIMTTVGEIEQDLGHASDAPWEGTGDGTVIAILKGIFLNTRAT